MKKSSAVTSNTTPKTQRDELMLVMFTLAERKAVEQAARKVAILPSSFVRSAALLGAVKLKQKKEKVISNAKDKTTNTDNRE